MMVSRKIEDNLLFCRGECEGGITDGSVDVDVAASGWSIMCPDDVSPRALFSIFSFPLF